MRSSAYSWSGSGRAPAFPPQVIDIYRSVGNGLRIGISSIKSSQPFAMSRMLRKANQNLGGKIKLVFPTFYMDKPSSLLREVDLPSFDVRVGIEASPNLDEYNSGLDVNYSATASHKKGLSSGFITMTVDLGDKVIAKGDTFAIWTAYSAKEMTEGLYIIPTGNAVNSENGDVREISTTSSSENYITESGMSIPTRIRLQTTVRTTVGVCAVLSTGVSESPLVVGDSIPEGVYDLVGGDARGDESGNRGWFDKWANAFRGLPATNLSKGSDRIGFVTTVDDEVTPSKDNWQWRRAIMKECNPTHVYVTLGINDLYTQTGAGIYDLVNQFSDSIRKQLGVPVYSSLLGPAVSWSGSGATEEDQSVGPRESVRIDFNNLNTGANIINPWGSVADMQSGKWKVDGVTQRLYSGDGIHPNSAGSDGMSKSVLVV